MGSPRSHGLGALLWSVLPLEASRRTPHDEGVDRAEFSAKLRGVEPTIVAHPARENGANPFGDVFQFKVAAAMQSPTAHAESHSLAGLFADRWDEPDKALAIMISRHSRPEGVA